jgi:hypothetical protein
MLYADNTVVVGYIYIILLILISIITTTIIMLRYIIHNVSYQYERTV